MFRLGSSLFITVLCFAGTSVMAKSMAKPTDPQSALNLLDFPFPGAAFAPPEGARFHRCDLWGFEECERLFSRGRCNLTG
jgi:hypothetical protein